EDRHRQAAADRQLRLQRGERHRRAQLRGLDLRPRRLVEELERSWRPDRIERARCSPNIPGARAPSQPAYRKSYAMVLRIERDHLRFKEIIKGRIKRDFKKYITQGEMIG